MPLRSISLAVLSCISLIACSSAPIDPAELAGKLKDKLTTDIKADGLKLFIYQANLVDEKSSRDNMDRTFPHEDRMRQKPQDPSEQRRNYKEKEAILEVWGQQVELGLTKTLEMTGYCREGYFELSRIIESGRGEIRGECKEGATDADRQKFVHF
ncbi:hypothetical protein L2744_07795 [Shewanella profunda]|uniref:hypothetical protein n=1 Tax=Shewanella profunda TaxID=254793 RepID=UPI00200C918B|nr:hypothetical protein [Shewanella profunda]MCL1089509.1 hypothetical protein [Shewanella profunda]